MPRTAKTTRKARSQARRRRRRRAAVRVAAALPPEPAYGKAFCLGCGSEQPAHALSSRGHCDTCVFIAAIQCDHPGGLSRYQDDEMYDLGSYAATYNSIDPPKARIVPPVGNGSAGPRHYLNLTQTPLSELDLPVGLHIQRRVAW